MPHEAERLHQHHRSAPRLSSDLAVMLPEKRLQLLELFMDLVANIALLRAVERGRQLLAQFRDLGLNGIRVGLHKTLHRWMSLIWGTNDPTTIWWKYCNNLAGAPSRPMAP